MGKIKNYAPVFGLFVFYLVCMRLRQAGYVKNYWLQVLMFSLINGMVTLGLYLINGITGQFSIGQAGFVSVGAYSSGVVTTLLFNFSSLPAYGKPFVFLLAVAAGGIVSGICGYLIGRPSLRLKGDYLAIVTLAFGEILRAIIRCIPQVGGPRGFTSIPRYSTLGWIVVFFALTVWLIRNYIHSSFGRACVSIREDELASETMGIDTTRYKVQAFVVGATVAGVAGALLAHVLGFLHPDQFNYVRSTDFLVYLYAGGAGAMSGAIVGAFILTILPEALRFLAGWRLVIYGLALVLMMLYRPTGICGGREFPFLVPLPRRGAETRAALSENG
ncbi:MAG: branched-chain amino acid ABC transporter permease [Synergistaceae bacterium]|jgi:branched-chain amino acid transport system permease protein|nr:branched-chain amino acid ABC transporter permease [Synergistaceae bacterium]